LPKWIAIAGVLGLLASTTAHANEDQAETCVRAKVWDGYGQGWAIRTMTTASLTSGATKNYMVTLYAGNEYQIQACGDSNVRNLDLLLYDTDGRIVARDDSKSREPIFTFKPKKTTTFYVVVYGQQLVDASEPAGVGVAVSYR